MQPVTTKYKIEEKKIPNLRFPGFDEVWAKKDFGNIVKKSKSKYDPRKNNKDYKCIELESISKESSLLLEVFSSSDQKSIKNKFNNGDVLFGKLRPNLRKFLLAPFNGVCSSEIWVLIGKEVSNEFLFRIIQTNKFYHVSMVTTGSKMPRADWNFISSFPFFIPSLPEQKKIASFLSAVDQKIQQLTRKKELLEKYKKGMMQKIFSQEIRFKPDENILLHASTSSANNDGKKPVTEPVEVTNYPDWEEKRLGDIGMTYNGLSGKSADDFGKGVPYVTYKQIFDNSKIDITKFEYVRIAPGEKQSKVEYGDILFTTSSETRLEVGFVSVLLDKIEQLHLNSFCFGYRINFHDEFSPKFARYLFRSEKFRRAIVKLGQGSTRYNMSKNEMKKLTIKIPVNKEQKKIADFLDLIQNKIESIKTQITQTQKFKKGLLQQMFV